MWHWSVLYTQWKFWLSKQAKWNQILFPSTGDMHTSACFKTVNKSKISKFARFKFKDFSMIFQYFQALYLFSSTFKGLFIPNSSIFKDFSSTLWTLDTKHHTGTRSTSMTRLVRSLPEAVHTAVTLLHLSWTAFILDVNDSTAATEKNLKLGLFSKTHRKILHFSRASIHLRTPRCYGNASVTTVNYTARYLWLQYRKRHTLCSKTSTCLFSK